MAQDPHTRNAIKKVLRDFGPMTMEEIAREIGKPLGTVNSCMNTARNTKAKHFYISDYDRRIGMKGGFAAIFSEGNRRDAAYPDTSRQMKDKRYYERTKQQKQILSRCDSSNPFGILIAQVTQ